MLPNREMIKLPKQKTVSMKLTLMITPKIDPSKSNMKNKYNILPHMMKNQPMKFQKKNSKRNMEEIRMIGGKWIKCLLISMKAKNKILLNFQHKKKDKKL